MKTVRRIAGQLAAYPSAIAGMVIILGLVLVAVYALVTMPVSEAVRLWRGGEVVWGDTPRYAWPVWRNWFSRHDLPATKVLSTRDGTARKRRPIISG